MTNINYDKMFEDIIKKMMNEFKYNKRMFYLWQPLFSELIEGSPQTIKDNLYLALNRIDEVESEKTSIKLFKKFKTKTPESTEPTQDDKIKERIISLDRDKEIEHKLIDYNDFALNDQDTFLLSLIWVETVGKLIDSTLSDKIFANRTSEISKSFFKPYFSMYAKFRDNCLDEMKYVIDKKESAVTVQLDLEKCFYHVNILYLKNEVDKIISTENDVDNLMFYKKINEFIFNYLFSYASDTSSEDSRLPIGFLPSNILINLYLSELDKMIIDELHPISYGRYVDDIIMVIQKDLYSKNGQVKAVNSIEMKLTGVVAEFNGKVDEEAQKYFSELGNDEDLKNNIKYKGVNIIPNNEKNIYFIITKNDDYNYVYKFMNSVKSISSDFYKLIDVNMMEDDINKAYQIVESPIKFSEILEIKKDKKYLSKIIAAVCLTIFSNIQTEDRECNIKLAKKFMKKFTEFIDNEFLIELYDYWFSITAIEIVSKLKNDKLDKVINIEEDEYKKLSIIKKIRNLQKGKMSGDTELEFVEKYLISLEDIFIIGRKAGMKKLARNYLLPTFLNSDIYNDQSKIAENMISMNYEKQLNTLYTYLSNEKNKDEDETNLMYVENFMRDFNCIDERYEGRESEIDECEKLKLEQVNIYNPDERIRNYTKYYINYNSSSETITALNVAADQNLDFLIFPEQGVRINDLYTVCKMVRKNNMVVIGGLDYFYIGNYIFNMAFAVIPVEMNDDNGMRYIDCVIKFAPKRYLAPSEYELFMSSNAHYKTVNRKEIYLPMDPSRTDGIHFSFKGARHSILNCYEATDIALRCSLVEKESHFVHLITNNKDVEFYDKLGETLSRDLMCITTITNYSLFGGTQIYIPYKDRFRRVVSYHKGSECINIHNTQINGQDIINKRFNNLNDGMKQNPPKYYYQNIRREFN